MDQDNPYQAPPDDLGLLHQTKRELGFWVYAFIAFKTTGVLVVGSVVWFARQSPRRDAALELHLWAILAWLVLGTLAALGVAFRVRLAKHLLVLHLVSTAAVELYAFVSMMAMDHGPTRDVAFDYGWAYFGMALWDLGWAAVFQFSGSLGRALA